jgi:tRNA A37 threonylcarbamoyladenosine dehydratase
MIERFIRLHALLGENKLKKITNAKVAIIGLGGVGGEACLALARSGVGTLIIQDFDIIVESNFNRQVVAYLDTIGKSKVDVMEEMIYQINPDCQVIKLKERFNESSSLFNYKFQYLIDAIDQVDNKILLIKQCLDHHITFISSMGTAKKMDIQKLTITEISKTTYDPLAKIIRKKLREEGVLAKITVLSSTEEPLVKGKELASYMPVTATAGLMLADYILKKIIMEVEE